MHSLSLLSFSMCCAAILLTSCSGEPNLLLGADTSSTEIDHNLFADANLEAAVRLSLEQPRGEIATAELAALQSLDANGREIRSLQNIGQLVGLRRLHLAQNEIHDLTPLAALDSLAVLDVSRNALFSVVALASLGQLTHLNLDFNKIASLDALSALSRLELLNLIDNRVTDLSALAGLAQLKSVELSGNPLSDAAFAEDLPALVRRGVVVNYYSREGVLLIPDLQLEALLRRTIRKNLGNLTREDLNGITNIAISTQHRVSDLRGIENT